MHGTMNLKKTWLFVKLFFFGQVDLVFNIINGFILVINQLGAQNFVLQ